MPGRGRPRAVPRVGRRDESAQGQSNGQVMSCLHRVARAVEQAAGATARGRAAAARCARRRRRTAGCTSAASCRAGSRSASRIAAVSARRRCHCRRRSPAGTTWRSRPWSSRTDRCRTRRLLPLLPLLPQSCRAEPTSVAAQRAVAAQTLSLHTASPRRRRCRRRPLPEPSATRDANGERHRQSTQTIPDLDPHHRARIELRISVTRSTDKMRSRNRRSAAFSAVHRLCKSAR